METSAEVFVDFLSTDEGGRRTAIHLGENAPAPYRPHFRVRSGDGAYLAVEFVDGPNEPILPSNSIYATVRFIAEVSYAALVADAVFDICEGGRVVGSGRVTRR